MFRTAIDLWRWRRLLTGLARRDFQLRYRASVIGFTWTLLEPAVQFALYFAAFSLLLGTRFASNPGVEPFGLFVISGLVPFWAFQETFVRAASLVREHALMVRHARFPLEVLLSATMLSVWVRHGLAFVLVAVIAGVLGKLSLASAGIAMAGVILLMVMSFGAGLVAMVVGVFLPDTARLTAVVSNIIFFASPIVYPLMALIPPDKQVFALINPFIGILAALRCFLMGGEWPSQLMWLSSFGWALVLLAVGRGLSALRSTAARDLA